MTCPVAERVSVKRKKWPGRSRAERHRHAHAYATIVLSGGFEEAGDRGRWIVGPGDVLLHEDFEAHVDRTLPCGVEMIELALPCAGFPSFVLGGLADPEALVRAAERSLAEAQHLLLSALVPARREQRDWPDLLAVALSSDPGLCIGAWAEAYGIAPATASRGFKRLYEISPVRFRREARMRIARRLFRDDRLTLAEVAAEAGYVDQAHMTCSMMELAGSTPGRMRRALRLTS